MQKIEMIERVQVSKVTKTAAMTGHFDVTDEIGKRGALIDRV